MNARRNARVSHHAAFDAERHLGALLRRHVAGDARRDSLGARVQRQDDAGVVRRNRSRRELAPWPNRRWFAAQAVSARAAPSLRPARPARDAPAQAAPARRSRTLPERGRAEARPRRRTAPDPRRRAARYNFSGAATWASTPSRNTATCRPIDRASDWSCVTKSAVAPAALRIAATASRVSIRKAASRAENGSSRRTSFGLGASARARATRCCSPPESSCGPRLAYDAGRPTLSSSASALRRSRRCRPREPEDDVGGDRQVGKQRPLLGDIANLPPLGRHVDPRTGLPVARRSR